MRIKLFKSEFKEFSTYEDKVIAHLISLYDENFDQKFQFSSIPSIVAGSYLLWVCWFFFNASAGKTIVKITPGNIPQATIMNTMISGSTSSLIVFYFLPFFFKDHIGQNNYNPVNICNGLLAGLVSVTASCNNIENYSAFVIGIIGGVVYILSTKLMEKFKIDDPCSASQIHAFCGLWGVLAVGIFDID